MTDSTSTNREPTISVIVICKNEAESIRECLDSVSWANEIIVLDSGSTDDTRDICREYTEHVLETDWPGYGPQKNRALDMATGDWVLSIDADERVPPELYGEIYAAIRSGEHDAYRVPRLSSYCGRWVRHSGWTPDHVTRLFRRGTARFSDDLVHERVVVDGSTGTLTTSLRHETFRTLEDVLGKIDEYSTAAARMRFDRGQRGSLTKAVLRGAWAFLRTYVLRAGFLDGRTGFMLAVSNAEGTYYRYLKMMLLQESAERLAAPITDDAEPVESREQSPEPREVEGAVR